MGTQKKVRDMSVWHDGTGEPSVALGKDGDLYTDLSSGKKYKKEGGIWVWKGGIGHGIKDTGTLVTPRTDLDFVGFGITDDETGDRTIITAPSKMTGVVDVLEGTNPESFVPNFSTDWTDISWVGRKWRLGNMLFMEIYGSLSAVPTGNELVLTLPDSLTLDDTIMDTIAQDNYMFGSVAFFDETATETYAGRVTPTSTTALRIKAELTSGTYDETVDVSPSVPLPFDINDNISIRIGVPIKTWSSTKTLNIGGIPALFMGKSSLAVEYAATTGSDQVVIFDTEDRDDNNMIDIGTEPTKIFIPAGCDTAVVTSHIHADNVSAITFEAQILIDGVVVVSSKANTVSPELTPGWSGPISAGSYIELGYNTNTAANIGGYLSVIAWNSQAPSASQHTFMVGCGYDTVDVEIATAVTTFRMPHKFQLTEVRASVTTPPTGAALMVDVKQNGVSIFSTLLSIDDGDKTSVGSAAPAVIATSAIVDDAEITIDVTQVGSTDPGTGLKLALIGY